MYLLFHWIIFGSSIFHPLIVELHWRAIVTGSKLFTFLAMAIGVLTVTVPNGKTYSPWALLITAIFVALYSWWSFVNAERKLDVTDVR